MTALALALILAVAGGSMDCRVAKVIDGDTLDAVCGGKTEHVRLYGVNAPELRHDFGPEARRFVMDAALGKSVRLLPRGRGHYGRLLAFVILPDGRSLNYELVKAGWARLYTGRFAFPDERTWNRYRLAEIAAISGGLGIWAGGK